MTRRRMSREREKSSSNSSASGSPEKGLEIHRVWQLEVARGWVAYTQGWCQAAGG